MARQRSLPLDLNSLAVFTAVAEGGGFTAAAERLGVAKARVSNVVQRLETALGTTLFHRTTRRVTLTDPGRRLHEASRPLLLGLADALAEAGDERAAAAGTLKLSTSIDHSVHFLADAVADFAQLHPQLRIDLLASDRIADMVAEGIDLAIRLGWPRDSTLRAVKLGEFEQFLVAAPEYLSRRGVPKRPEDLAAHDWIAFTRLPASLTWKLVSRRGRAVTVRMAARLRTDSSATLRSLVLRGAGVSAINRLSVEGELRGGRLERLLPEWSLPRGGIFAIFPPARHIAVNARAFTEFYRARIDSVEARAS